VVDDPTAKQRVVQGKAGAYAGAKQYGESANLPRGASKRGGNNTPRAGSSSRGEASSPSPLAGESLPPTGSGGRAGGSASRGASRVHKPHLDEMHGPESLPFRQSAALPKKPFGNNSRVIQPTDSRQSGPEFGPSPRSSGGAPGHRGGWKKR